jgi:hypothetical protein
MPCLLNCIFAIKCGSLEFELIQLHFTSVVLSAIKGYDFILRGNEAVPNLLETGVLRRG